MKEILIYVLGVVVCSGVFTAFYRAAMHQRTSFRTARMFLVGSLAAAAVIPAFNIPVWSSEPVALPVLDVPVTPYEAADTVIPEQFAADLWQAALWVVYGLGIAALIGIMVFQSVKIRRMKRRAEVFAAGEYDVAVSPEVHAPFSFLQTVYIGQETPPDEMRQIILHETSHIRHRHSVEKIIMETLKTLMWFNPFAWIASRLLNEVHEFEADRDVLHGGCTVEEYLPVIFRQVFGYIPEISTGLGNSLTKKRFEMMTKKLKHGRYSWLRAAGVLPVAAAMLMLFGFTRRPAEIVTQQPEKKEVPAATAPRKAESDTTYAKENITVVGYGTMSKTTGEVKKIAIKGDMPDDVFVWITGANPHELKGSMDALDPNLIKSISVLKDGNYPEEVREAMGDRKVKGVMIIEPKDANTINIATDGKMVSDGKSLTLYPDKSLQLAGGKPFIWIAGEKREITSEELNTIDPNAIESVSVLKNGSNYPEEIAKAISGRKFDGVVIIEPKEQSPGLQKAEAVNTENMLKIVDGKEVSNEDFAKIDSDQIESVSVLKNTAGVEVYGERGGKGVILVEMKKDAIAYKYAQETPNKSKETLKITGIKGGTPFVWVDGNSKYEIPYKSIKTLIDPDAVRAVTIYPVGNTNIPQEAVDAMGNRDFKQVVLIHIKKIKL